MQTATIREIRPAAGADDGVRELHGALVREKEALSRILIVEDNADSLIHIEVGYEKRQMTPRQARYLARKLYRLARRIEKRREKQATRHD